MIRPSAGLGIDSRCKVFILGGRKPIVELLTSSKALALGALLSAFIATCERIAATQSIATIKKESFFMMRLLAWFY
jgi:hypothetical protein